MFNRIEVTNYEVNADIFTVKCDDTEFFVVLNDEQTLDSVTCASDDVRVSVDEVFKCQRDVAAACVEHYRACEID